MLCDHRRQQHSWFGCRAGSDVSSVFYHGFCYGKFDDQPVEDAQQHWIKQVQHERFYKSISEFISNRCHKNPLLVMFVLPAEMEECRHGEGYESANMSRPNLFNVLMKLSDSELYCILHGGD